MGTRVSWGQLPQLLATPSAQAALWLSIRTCLTSTAICVVLGVPLARCEFLDPPAIRAINAYSKMDLREGYTLFFEFHGSPAGVAEQVELVQQLAADEGGTDFAWAEKPEERTRLWNARHDAYFAGLQMRPGARAISTDTCVPISRLAASVEGARKLLEASGFPSLIVGHVGDGNFHCLILVDVDNPDEVARAEALNREIVSLALSLGGTCTGEHGIGLHKMDFLETEAGAEGVALMARIKAALDPEGLSDTRDFHCSGCFMSLSLQLTAEDDALLTLAADRLHISKSEFVRRSIAAYAARVIPAEKTEAEIDAMYIGQGGGLRDPDSVKDPLKRAVLEKLREKHVQTVSVSMPS